MPGTTSPTFYQVIYTSLIPTVGFFPYQCKLRLTLFCISELTLAEFTHSVLNIVKSFLCLVLFSSYLHMQKYHPLHNQVSIYIRKILEYSHTRLAHGRKTNLTDTRLHLFETIQISYRNTATSEAKCTLTDTENNTWACVDMEFLFEYSTRQLTSERCERVRCRVAREKRNFISASNHVLFC